MVSVAILRWKAVALTNVFCTYYNYIPYNYLFNVYILDRRTKIK